MPNFTYVFSRRPDEVVTAQTAQFDTNLTYFFCSIRRLPLVGCNSYLLPTKCLQEQEWQWCQRWSDCQTWISGDRKWPLSDAQFCALPHTAKQCPTALQSATQCHSMPRMPVVRRSNRRRRSISGGEFITTPIGHFGDCEPFPNVHNRAIKLNWQDREDCNVALRSFPLVCLLCQHEVLS